uniref:EGF-like domain-containing protein n=1 Tax=Cyanoderma ruficeps TaxID=181631 RepID=A0A8C3QYI1_9PASS
KKLPPLMSFADGMNLRQPHFMGRKIRETQFCGNGGICLSGLNDNFYSCECPEGFTDPNCSSLVEVGKQTKPPPRGYTQ